MSEYYSGDQRVLVALQAQHHDGSWHNIQITRCLEHEYPSEEAKLERAKDAWMQSSIFINQHLRIHVEYPKV